MSNPKWIVGPAEYNCWIINPNDNQIYDLTPGVPTKLAGQPTKVVDVKGALHNHVAIDDAGNLYAWGSMLPFTTDTPSKVTTDAVGNPFTNIKAAIPFDAGAGPGIMALKSDGTLWVMGVTQNGMKGDGTAGGVSDLPSRVPFPTGTVITKFLASTIAVALDSLGQVWTWGNAANAWGIGNILGQGTDTPDTTRPGIAVTGAIDIANGRNFSFALLATRSLVGWGFDTRYLGLPNSPNSNRPILLDSALALPKSISQIVCNYSCTYATLTDSSIWAWGDNGQGMIGNGTELNMAARGYTYWPGVMDLPQIKPVQIGIGLSFVKVNTHSNYVFYAVAEDTNGNLYSWGRNKGGVMGNGVVPADGFVGALAGNYPNSWDVPWMTPINPFGITSAKPTTSPICITNPSAPYCPAIARASTLSQAKAGPPQNVTGTTATLDGSASTGTLNYYFWKQISGPSQALIVLPTSIQPKVTGLQQGQYIFQLSVTDDVWKTTTSTTTVTVTSTTGPAPCPTVVKVTTTLTWSDGTTTQY